jgi:hypothetical protein
MINDLRPLAHGRVRELVDILSEFEQDGDEGNATDPSAKSAIS